MAKALAPKHPAAKHPLATVDRPCFAARSIHCRHGGDVEEPASVQRLVDSMLDRAEAASPNVEHDIWIPSLESLLLPPATQRP